MTRDQIISRLKKRKADIKAKGVVHLALFGSRVRGDHRPDSDIDVIVDIDPSLPRFSLIDLAGVKRKLDEILGLETNIVERKTIKPGSKFAQRIADDICRGVLMAAATVPDRLKHILRSVDAIIGYWKGKKRTQFDSDEWGRAATERHLEIISEASRHIPAKDRADHPQIPWKDITGIGNVLRYRYDTVSDDRIWEIVTLDLRALRTAVKKIMAKHESRK